MSLIMDTGVAPELRSEIYLRDKAMSGDLVFVATPATKSTAHLHTSWTRSVVVELQTAAGEVHTWFNKAITTGVSIADDSTAGTATIGSTTLTFTNGRASVTVTGSAHDWLAGDTNTLTVAQATILGYTVAAKTSVETFT